ncbi:hypothetical protein SAMN04488503_0612 [Humidesulfovibrio mexicanus]|uniref:Uncharacterized protein n=1 Tax=Humidesulfovibrio mexicanus TaxID=147047 RepID=A0A238Y1D9_9BACT|nr:hypothetical protein [Humidesulfovibrio mexicanus]SNR65035.1 hypothetical protein SAMN04488503_0612 [Humidesulfovibrio mexicanus]
MDIRCILDFLTQYAVALTALTGILGILSTVVIGLLSGRFALKSVYKAAELNARAARLKEIQQVKDTREALNMELTNLLEIYNGGEGLKILNSSFNSPHHPQRGYIPEFGPPLMLYTLGPAIGKLDKSDCGFFLLAYRTAMQLQSMFKRYQELLEEQERPRTYLKECRNFESVIKTQIHQSAQDIRGTDENMRQLIRYAQELLSRPLDEEGKPIGSVEETLANLKKTKTS